MLGAYFDRLDLTDYVEERIDGPINFPPEFPGKQADIGDAPGGVNLRSDDNWSIRWTGYVRIETAGEWVFHTDSDDGVRLWVNGEQLIENWTIHPLARDSGAIHLKAGWTPIKLEFFQAGSTSRNNRAAVRLLFAGPGKTEQVIPKSHLASHQLTGVDIGKVGLPGGTIVDHTTGSYVVEGSGADIQMASDMFHFANTRVTGDCTITAKVVSLDETNQYAKAGVMFRQSLDPGSRNVVMEMKASTGSEFQYRSNDNQATTVGRRVPAEFVSIPYWVRLQRRGNTFFGYSSPDGVNWELQDSASIAMSETACVGIAVTAHDNTMLASARLENVTLSYEPLTTAEPRLAGTGVTGFVPLLSTETFDPLAEDSNAAEGFVTDDNEFYTFRGQRFDVDAARQGPGFNEDGGKSPDTDDIVFRMTPDGMLHILGIPQTKQPEPFGYLSTEDGYRNYHLSLEYRWGKKRFPPRARAKRDSGLLYHAVGPDVVWTTDVETQIQEGDTGDFFFLGESPRATSGLTLGSSEGTVSLAPKENRYQPGGEAVDTGGGVVKFRTVDLLDEWNRVEVIVEQDNVTALVNGIVVNRATNLRMIRSGFAVPLTEGKIALQAEGAEIFYRNVKIKPTHATGSRGGFAVLLFQEPGDPDPAYPSVAATMREAIESLGQQNGFLVDAVSDSAGVFTAENLKKYSAVIWHTPAGDLLDDEEQQAFKAYIQGGGGFVGLHSTAAAERDWPWFEKLVGARAIASSETAALEVELGTLRVDSEASVRSGGIEMHHPAVDSLPSEWRRLDRWLRYASDPRSQVNVLQTRDEGLGGQRQPIVWWRDISAGRSFYSGLGGRPQAAHEPLFLMHLLGGIEYAAGVSRVPPRDAIILFDGSNTEAFLQLDGQSPIDWQIDDEGHLFIIPENGPAATRNVRSRQSFLDYRLHLEFNVPATRPGIPEQRRGNSGVYLHSSYEVQLLDSYAAPGFDDRHCGAIYAYKAADRNASLPAETWQVYDIDFTAPRFDENNVKTSNARVTVYLNGVLIHDDVEISGATNGGLREAPGPQPFFLQDHDKNSKLKFRNIWVLPRGER